MKLNVPVLKQNNKYTCGPVCLRMVFDYFGEKVSLNKIIKNIGGIKQYGIRTIKLADFAKKSGFRVECYSYNTKLSRGRAKIKKPEKQDIIKFLKKKIPVIIAVRSFILYREKPSSEGHFVVITEYEKNKFRYNDPYDGKQHRINESDLMFAWFNNTLDSSAYLLAIQPN